MKVGIDGFALERNDSGIEVYTRKLINGVASHFPVEVYTYKPIATRLSTNIQSKHSNFPGKVNSLKKLKWQLFDIVDLVSSDVQIFHCPHFILPAKRLSSGRVVTVHDLAFLKHPEFFDKRTRLYYWLFLRQSLLRADAIICISDSCLEDTVQFFPFSKKKVFRVHNGFKDFSAIAEDNSILQKLQISSPFLLMIGTLNPRKNIDSAIKAFEKIAAENDLELIIVGELRRDFQANYRNPRIKWTGYINDERLASLYKHAELLLFPSYYEGFGFPILEAMSVGLPVVTSSVSSMPEISSYPRELLCDPDNVQTIVNRIREFLSAPTVFDFVNHAKQTTQKFSWNKMAKETIEVYEYVQKGL